MTALNVKDIFNDLHQIPEVGFQEFKTSAYLAEAFRSLKHRLIWLINWKLWGMKLPAI